MAFLLPVLEDLGSGLLGNALGGALGSGTAGNAENSAMNALNTQDETFQLGMYSSEIQNQEQLQMQSEVFDQMMDERSENMREVDTSDAFPSPVTLEAMVRSLREIVAGLPLEGDAKSSRAGISP